MSNLNLLQSFFGHCFIGVNIHLPSRSFCCLKIGVLTGLSPNSHGAPTIHSDLKYIGRVQMSFAAACGSSVVPLRRPNVTLYFDPSTSNVGASPPHNVVGISPHLLNPFMRI